MKKVITILVFVALSSCFKLFAKEDEKDVNAPVPWNFTQGDHVSGINLKSLTLDFQQVQGVVFNAKLNFVPSKNLTFQCRRNYYVYYNNTLIDYKSASNTFKVYAGSPYNEEHGYMVQESSPRGQYTFQQTLESQNSG